MNLLGFAWVAIAFLNLGQVYAWPFDHHEALGMACGLGAQELFTTCERENYGCFCDSTLYVYAVENCIGREAHYNSTLMGMAFDKFNYKFCELHNAVANTTNVWSPENQAKNPTVTEKAYKLAYKGEQNNMSQKIVSVWLGVGLIFYWVAIVCLVAFSRFVRYFSVRLFTARIVMRRSTLIIDWINRYLTWPALFGTRHMQRFEYFRGWIGFSLPTRIETVVVCIYFLLTLIFMLTPYSFMNNDPLFTSRWKEMMRYGSDRAGIIATVQFPLFFLFAMRNNVLIWVTGWSFSTFNTYHRAIARINYILLIVHAVMKHIFSASYGGSLVKYYYPVPYFRYGVAALGLFSLMVFMAIFRSRMYEVFYRLHQAMALGGVILSIYHLNGIGYKSPLWISIAIWATDWTVRVCRILLFNINFVLPPLPGARKSSFATARVYSGEMIKLSITTPVRWICKPGQYVFVHTSQWELIGGHPFSVVGAPKGVDTGLEVVIKARAGETKKLFKRLDDRSCTPQYPVTIPVYVEGPYGVSAPVTNFEEGLFFAGGIGITGVLPYIEQMATSRSSNLENRFVKFFWAIRDKSDIDPFAERILKLSEMVNVSIRIFQRSAKRPPRPASGVGVDYEMNTFTESPGHLYNKSPGLVNVKLNEDVPWSDEKESESSASPPQSKKRVSIINPLMSKRRLSVLSHKGGPYNEQSRDENYMRKRMSFRKSIAELVKSGNPEDDEGDYDYGKHEYQEHHPHHFHSNSGSSTITNSTRNTDTEIDEELDGAPTATQLYESRKNDPTFVDAGFTDTIQERRVSNLNPFDDTIYPYNESTKLPDEFAEDNAQAFIHEVYGLIEPVGMDIAELIRSNFKHSDGSVCVLGCGPDRMMDMLRWSCCECLHFAKNGAVDYFEEAFRW